MEGDAGAWPSFAAAVGGRADAVAPAGDHLVAFKEVGLRLHPHYREYRGEKWNSDQASAFAMEVNRAIDANDQRQFAKLYDSERPFTVSWKVTATNLSTGKPVPVFMDDRSRTEGVGVVFFERHFAQDSAVVRFHGPGSAGVVECRVQALVVDKKGTRVLAEEVVWSHGLAGFRKLEEYAGVVQALAGLKDRSRLIAPTVTLKPEERELYPDAGAVHVKLVEGMLMGGVRDGEVTVEELKAVLGVLGRFFGGN